MTDTEQSAVATLRELLPDIEGGEGLLEDETLGKLWCALRGVDYILAIDAALPSGDPTFHIQYKSNDEDIPVGHFSIAWERRWDTDLTAADDLCRECGYERASGDDENDEGACKFAAVWSNEWDAPIPAEGHHPISEPRAILSALVRARIAALEATK